MLTTDMLQIKGIKIGKECSVPEYQAGQGLTVVHNPTLKKGSYIGFGLSVISFVRSSVLPFIRHNFFVSAQYLEKHFIESSQILYMHLN